MNLKKLVAIAAFCLPVLALSAQTKAPESWFTLDPAKDNVNGTGGDEALKRLKEKGKKGETVIVAVLDSGVEIDHEDLKDVIWTNPNEIPGNGKDDDNNGYIDDIHGWNFLGGKDGKNILHESLELTREYTRLSKRFKDTDPKKLSAENKKEYDYYLKVKEDFETQRADAEKDIEANLKGIKKVEDAFAQVEKALGKKEVTPDEVNSIKTEGNAELTAAVELLKRMAAQGITSRKDIEEAKKEVSEGGALKYMLNPDYNPRDIVGDDPYDTTNRFYGNNDYEGPDAFHGTHVAGIIAANRNNNVGIRGVADNVKIMTVRCVPDGDERDKDVANAIYYAVDNGASIINMSFGKGYSPQKEYVDAAMRYAAEHDVLLVHAAGNSAQNNDETGNFPNDNYEKAVKKGLFKKEKNVPTWMEIGALHYRTNEKRVAGFSNYGKKNVDLFSPGVQLYSTVPDGKYGNASGTSMASPAAAGVAAIIRSYYPELSAMQVKKIMEKSVVKQDGEVTKPGSTDKVKFTELCVTGGTISATNAVELAEKTKAAKKPKKAIWRDAGGGKLKKNLAKEPRA
ncbi:MAG: S8 family serine peptidase [Saprospiraceae bacterium]|nr:S8 family serine peptidase [Saprospiraceae bacterium]